MAKFNVEKTAAQADKIEVSINKLLDTLHGTKIDKRLLRGLGGAAHKFVVAARKALDSARSAEVAA